MRRCRSHDLRNHPTACSRRTASESLRFLPDRGAETLDQGRSHASTIVAGAMQGSTHGPSPGAVQAIPMQKLAPVQTSTEATSRPLLAIALMCAASAVFAGLDTTAKYLGTATDLPAAQVIWLRFLGQFLAMVTVLGLIAVPGLTRTRKPVAQLARSLLLLGSTAFNFLALRHLRLDQTTTIGFLTPLVVALLAGPFLGEWIGWRRTVAILVGFAGILVAIRPGAAPVHPAVLLSLASMLCYAAFSLITRFL